MDAFNLDSLDWPKLVASLGGEEALAASALERKAFVRARGVKSAPDLLRLALLYGPGGHSLRTVSALAAARGVADVSDVAILGRMKASADWLQFLCEERLSAVGKDVVGEGLAARVRIVDGSRIAGPGDGASRRTAWRLHLCYDPGAARIVEASVTTTKQGERLDRLAVTVGEARLADRGFPQPDGINNTLEAKADALVRVTWNSVQLRDLRGEPLDWLKLYAESEARGGLDIDVRLHKERGKFEPVPMRLCLFKKTPEAAAKALAAAKRASKKNKRRTDPRTLAGAGHIALLTSLGRDALTAQKIGALYRVRWQVELAFKRLKSILRMDRLPAKDPQLARAWLYAHLLVALLIEETLAPLGAASP